MHTEIPNINYIKELAGEDTVFEKEFINIIKNEFPIEKKTYETLLHEKKWKETADIVHKIKHKFNIFSMHQAYESAVHYEIELRKENRHRQKIFEQALQKIEAFLKTI